MSAHPTHASDSSTSPRQTPHDTGSRFAVDLRRLPGIRRLAADYGSDFPAVAPFFAGNPADRAAWADAIARARVHTRDRRAIADVLAAQQERRNAPPAAREAGAALANPQTVAVVTGQQAGLFGGPLFTLLKALTAIKLARQVSSEHGVPAVAVFWIDAEDHDWNEVRTTTVFDESLTPREIALPETSGDATPVGAIALDGSIDAALDALEQTLPGTEFRAEVMASLRNAYTQGTGMAEAFGRWLERTLGTQGLVVYDASDAAAKPLARAVFVRELSTPGASASLAGKAGATLEASGYHAQVQPSEDGLGLFRLDGGRHAIKRKDGSFVAGDRPFASDELLREADQQPSRFSPNVLLRPIVQDTLFPTVCYVAGPNELAYLCQLRDVYQHFGVPMPLLYPRASATILDSGGMKFLMKNEMPLEALHAQDEAALNDLLQQQMPPEVDASFADALASVESRMARLIEVVPAVDATLEGAARSTLKRMQHDLETLHGKILQAAKRRDETLRRQFLRTRALAFPGGEAQERTIGF
ncbi:MAG: bacillithiol biosynthesis cysteine-adding enzyme BshC, partial [Vicinamibacterales bacterium]